MALDEKTKDASQTLSEEKLHDSVNSTADAAAELFAQARSAVSNERRQFFRMPTILPLKIWTQDDHGNRTDVEETLSYDLSATGISFICEHEVTTKSFVNVEIVELPFLDGFTVDADVVRCVPHVTKNGSKVYLVACDFKSQLTRDERTRLLRSVTVLQRVRDNKKMPAF